MPLTSVGLPARHVAVIACWSAPHCDGSAAMFACHYVDEFIAAASFFFIVDLINQSLVSCGDLFFFFFLNHDGSFPCWWAQSLQQTFFFLSFFQKQPIKEATPAGTLSHGTPSLGQSAIGGDGVRATCRAGSQTRRSRLNWQRAQRWEEGVWLFGCPAV